MNFQHKQLSLGKWFNLSFFAQMANIGSEVERAISWKKKNKKDYSRLAFFRSLELLELTIADKKNINKLKELTRLKEMLSDYFFFNNDYQSTDDEWRCYFYPFNYALSLKHSEYPR